MSNSIVLAKEPISAYICLFAFLLMVEIVRSNWFFWLWSFYTFPFRIMLYLVVPLTLCLLSVNSFLPKNYHCTPWLMVYMTSTLLVNVYICSAELGAPLLLLSILPGKLTVDDTKYRAMLYRYAVPSLQYAQQLLRASLIESGEEPTPLLTYLLSERFVRLPIERHVVFEGESEGMPDSDSNGGPSIGATQKNGVTSTSGHRISRRRGSRGTPVAASISDDPASQVTETLQTSGEFMDEYGPMALTTTLAMPITAPLSTSSFRNPVMIKDRASDSRHRVTIAS